jgi:hypothetical protein
MVDSLNPVVALALAGQQPAPQKVNGPRPQSPGVPKENVTAPRIADA